MRVESGSTRASDRFYYGTPSENEQLFGARRKIPEYKFVGEVVAYDAG